MIKRGGISGKNGQMKLSFGMIFSIILIIIFLAFAFYSIRKFIGISDAVKIGNFKDDLESGIEKLWKATQGSQEMEYFLPKKVAAVCFVDYSSAKRGPKKDIYDKLKQVFYGDENMIFYPIGSSEGLDSAEIKHIDINKTTEDENPFCVDNIKGKTSMTLKKNYGENLVTIIR